MGNVYKWQGEPVLVRWGYCRVVPDNEKVMTWYNYECDLNALHEATSFVSVPAVEVTTTDGRVFCIANHFGIGGHKLSKGGWPNVTHFSFPDWAEFRESSFPRYEMKRLREPEYAKHEEGRKKWQFQKFGDTEDYKRVQALMKLARSKRFIKLKTWK